MLIALHCTDDFPATLTALETIGRTITHCQWWGLFDKVGLFAQRENYPYRDIPPGGVAVFALFLFTSAV